MQPNPATTIRPKFSFTQLIKSHPVCHRGIRSTLKRQTEVIEKLSEDCGVFSESDRIRHTRTRTDNCPIRTPTIWLFLISNSHLSQIIYHFSLSKSLAMAFKAPIPEDSPFTLQNIPFGVISTDSNPKRRCATALGDYAIELTLLWKDRKDDGLGLTQSLYDIFSQVSDMILIT